MSAQDVKRFEPIDLSESDIIADSNRLYGRITLAIQAVTICGLIGFLVRWDWENAFLAIVVIGLNMIPALARRCFQVYVPPEFQLVATAFVFLTLFLGSAGDFYYRYWWWDWLLHAGSGFLLGIVGFISIYLLNQTDRLPDEVRPGFRCLFGVLFAVLLGVLWETFEFFVDEIWPYANMQSRETGVVDTMHDLIVDVIGATIVGLMGWAYFKSGRYSFIADGVRLFVRKNPRLFGRHR